MPEQLGRLKLARKSGAERFHRNGLPTDFDLLDFWRWSGSDLVDNTARGVLAEFVVAKALGFSTRDVRESWAVSDLVTDGLRIQVKSSAFVQSWTQKRYSTVQFDVQKRRAWNADTNEMDKHAARHADVFVFALLAHRDKATIDPLDLTQWQFFALATRVLDERKRSQHSITLKSLVALAGPPVDFWHLPEAVAKARRAEHSNTD